LEDTKVAILIRGILKEGKAKLNKEGQDEKKGYCFGWRLSEKPMVLHLLNIVKVPEQ